MFEVSSSSFHPSQSGFRWIPRTRRLQEPGRVLLDRFSLPETGRRRGDPVHHHGAHDDVPDGQVDPKVHLPQRVPTQPVPHVPQVGDEAHGRGRAEPGHGLLQDAQGLVRQLQEERRRGLARTRVRQDVGVLPAVQRDRVQGQKDSPVPGRLLEAVVRSL